MSDKTYEFRSFRGKWRRARSPRDDSVRAEKLVAMSLNDFKRAKELVGKHNCFLGASHSAWVPRGFTNFKDLYRRFEVPGVEVYFVQDTGPLDPTDPQHGF